MRRWVTAVVLTVAVGADAAVGASAASHTVPIATAVAVYRAPVTPLRVVRAFDPSTTPYGPGHRGVDLAVASGAIARSAGAGVVRFAGRVTGRGVVVVVHPDGVSTEYEPLRVTVRAGSPVAAGAALGVVAGRHGACAPGRCLHWGAKRGGNYLDPLLLLTPLGPVRLLPWDGGWEP